MMSDEKIQRNDLPKYLEIANDFRAGIKLQKYKPGDLLPDSRALSRQLGCNRRTILKAFDTLEKEGHVHKIHGSGVYVDSGSTQEESHPPLDVENLSVIGVADGFTIENHSSKLVEHHMVNTILDRHDENRQYEPLRISYINSRDLKARLNFCRNVLKGLIIYGGNYEQLADNVQYALKQSIPTVFAGLLIPSQLNNISVDTVYVDEFQGGYDIGRYFIENGHTEIGFIYDYSHRKCGRFEGFTTALKENGLKAVTSREILKDLNNCQSKTFLFYRNAGAACTKKLMENKKRPTAIMCQNDLTAIGAFEELTRMKISLPDEVELFGFADDIESRLFFANRTNPISTVALPRKTLAEAAFKLLVQRMNNPGLPAQVVTLPTTIIHRETTKEKNVYDSTFGKDFVSDREIDIKFINEQITEKLI